MDQTTLLFARWLSVAVGGLFSYQLIDLAISGRLKFYLADQKFHYLVLGGGVMLGVIVLLKLRALALATMAPAHLHDHHHHDHDHAHDHDHGHDHGHDHAHRHDHGHDHSHEHSVSLWRFIVLTIPLMIWMMGLVPQGLESDVFATRMDRRQKEAIAAAGSAALPPGRKPGGEIINTDARELMDKANQADGRAFWQSTTSPVQACVSGQFVPDPRFKDRYRLMRIKITCCAADATPVGVSVVGPINSEWQYGDWLEVTGPVTFVEVPDDKTGKTQYFPVIHQQSAGKTEVKNYLQ